MGVADEMLRTVRTLEIQQNIVQAQIDELVASRTEIQRAAKDATFDALVVDGLALLSNPETAKVIYAIGFQNSDEFTKVFYRTLRVPFLPAPRQMAWIRADRCSPVPVLNISVMPNLSDEAIADGWAKVAPVLDAQRQITTAELDLLLFEPSHAEDGVSLRVDPATGVCSLIATDDRGDEYVEAEFVDVPAALTFIRSEYPAMDPEDVNRARQGDAPFA